VVDLLQRTQLGCGIEAVILTGGERESRAEGVRCVPKQDLLGGLRVMLEKRELGLPVKYGPSRQLARRRDPPGMWGTKSLGLSH
jgi:hypothetical protein